MEGYSVTEAASILGVPTERVWELLARGVLSGAAEGETGMRVYLQPRPAPAPPAAESARPNGDFGQREPERELSPFRELLTEFRNLTERYGQALLALGEARGEVAALRSRVDLLEARMDLRLPMGGGMPAPPQSPAPMPEPMVRPPATEREVARGEGGETEAAEPGEAAESTAEEDRPSRRRRSSRHATESFAEALARAEDPTRPELPGAADAAAALAALRAESSVEQPATDAALPRELPAAEPMEAARAELEPVSEATPAQPEAEPEPAVTPERTEPEATAARPEPEAAEQPEPEREQEATAERPEPETTADEPEPQPVAEIEPEVQPQSAAEEAVSAEALPDAAPISFDPDRYTVAIEEPDWWVEEATPEAPPGDAPREEPAPATTEEERLLEEGPAPEDASAEAEATVAEKESADAEEATVADAEEEPEEEAPPADRHEETMLWFGTAPEAAATDTGEGADEMEVVGGSTTRPPLAGLPGSSELDEAMAALDAIAGRPPASAAEPDVQPESAPEPEPEPQPAASPAWPMADRSAASQPPPASVSSAPVRRADPQRLATTPASRAYRRLRRIFPG